MTFVIMRHNNVTIAFLRAPVVTLEIGRRDIRFTLYVLDVINITEFCHFKTSLKLSNSSGGSVCRLLLRCQQRRHGLPVELTSQRRRKISQT